MQVKDSPCGNVLQSTIHTSTYVTAHGKFLPGVPVYHCIPNSWRGNSLGMRLTAVIAAGCSLRQKSINVAFSWIKRYQTLCCVCLAVFQLKVPLTSLSEVARKLILHTKM